MAKFTGVLLQGADGALYLVEGGLRASRIDPDDPARRDDPAFQAMIARVRNRLADQGQLGELEARMPPPPADDEAPVGTMTNVPSFPGPPHECLAPPANAAASTDDIGYNIGDDGFMNFD